MAGRWDRFCIPPIGTGSASINCGCDGSRKAVIVPILAVNLRVLVTPSSSFPPISDTSLVRAWRPQVFSKEAAQNVALAIVDAKSPDDEALCWRECEALANATASAKQVWAALRFEWSEPVAHDAAASPTSASPRGEGADWTPEYAKLRDLNGAGVRAALPKVLASCGDAGVVVRASSQGVEVSRDVRCIEVQNTSGRAVSDLVDLARQLACAGAVPAAACFSIDRPAEAGAAEFCRVIAYGRELVAAAERLRVPLGFEFRSCDAATSPRDGFRCSVEMLGALPAMGRELGSGRVAAGEKLILLGETEGAIGGSRYLKAIHELCAGAPASVDFAREKKLRDAIAALVGAGVASAARSVSDGGLLVAACRLLFAHERTSGAVVDVTSLGGTRADALLFGEGAGRAIIAVAPARIGTALSEAHMRGVSAVVIGEVNDRPKVELKTRSLATDWAVEELRRVAERGQR